MNLKKLCERLRNKEKRMLQREAGYSHLLIHCPNTNKEPGWARPKLGANISWWVFLLEPLPVASQSVHEQKVGEFAVLLVEMKLAMG